MKDLDDTPPSTPEPAAPTRPPRKAWHRPDFLELDAGQTRGGGAFLIVDVMGVNFS